MADMIKSNNGLFKYNYPLIVSVFCLGGFALCLIAFYPGYMSVDSIVQYESALSGVYSDWHPPIMSLVWGVVANFKQGPESLLVLHLAVLWLALALITIRLRKFRASTLVCLLGVLPWVINFSGVLWKDIGGAYALLACIAILTGKPNWKNLCAFFLLIFYASNVRHNMLVPAVPLCFFAFRYWNDLPNRHAVLYTLVVILAIKFCGNIINYQVLDAEKTYPENYMIVDDLAQLSLNQERSLLNGVEFSDIQDCAEVDINGTKTVARHFCLIGKDSYSNNNPLKNSDLKEVWLEAVFDDPLHYVFYRLDAFGYLMRSPDKSPYFIWLYGGRENRFSMGYQDNYMTELVRDYVLKTSNYFPFLFKPYWWLVVTFILIILGLLCKKTYLSKLSVAISISSVLYLFTYIPAVPMADFRYIYWSVNATSLSVIFMIIFLLNPTTENQS
ncbi:hypothetical protein [Enterovibrio norvegicus]|uniref:hypothetical protein n=1 Tax=Enterovibrio norvegicus TaxID=188144 RepID=UPI00354F434E